MPAMEEMCPTVVNRKCAKHIYDNFKLKWSTKELRGYFWHASTAFTQYSFNKAMTNMRNAKPDAYDWLMAIPLGHWARHSYDTAVKIDHVTNNCSESFNAWIDPLRAFSVYSILEGLRQQIMKRVTVRRRKGLKCQSVVMPKLLSKLNDIATESRNCRLVTESGRIFEIEDLSFTFVVNLDLRTCVCKRWDISGIPCRHAWLAIQECREDPVSYLSENHTKAAYRRTYDIVMHPIPQSPFWPQDLTNDVCKPPDVKRAPGRPVVQRIRHPMEQQRVSQSLRAQKKCSLCLQTGHNKRKCVSVLFSSISLLVFSSFSLLVFSSISKLMLFFM